MSYATQAAAYREREIGTASPGRLVVMVFDHVLANLARATIAYKNSLLEQRLEAVAKARDGIMELVATLDVERGGAIAQQLSAIYAFVLGELAGVGARFDEAKVARLANIMRELREAFATIASEPAQQAAQQPAQQAAQRTSAA